MLTVQEYFNKSREDMNKVWNTKISVEENIIFRHLEEIKEQKQILLTSAGKK